LAGKGLKKFKSLGFINLKKFYLKMGILLLLLRLVMTRIAIASNLIISEISIEKL